MNRGGVYCMEQTVQNLGLGLLVKGISTDEANHEGVCVQEVPAYMRDKDPLDPAKPYTTYKALNLVVQQYPGVEHVLHQ